jgi:hypothetical protein
MFHTNNVFIYYFQVNIIILSNFVIFFLILTAFLHQQKQK